MWQVCAHLRENGHLRFGHLSICKIYLKGKNTGLQVDDLLAEPRGGRALASAPPLKPSADGTVLTDGGVQKWVPM